MELRCPNCATSQGRLDESNTGPLSCSGCGKNVYLPVDFPAIVAATFPPQQAPPVPLTPFFGVDASRLPAEMQDGDVPDVPAEPISDEHRVEAPTAPVESESKMVSGELPVEIHMSRMAVPSAVVSGEESMQLLGLAGGSFAAALTPPPVEAAPEQPAEASLGSMSTLGPPPWDNGPPAPPPLKPQDEQWSVASPPPLIRTPPPTPPSVEDDLAASLGLPKLEEIAPEPQATPAAVSVAEEAAAAERNIERGGKRTMLIAGVVTLLAGAAMAFIVGGEVLERTEPPAPIPQRPPVVDTTPSSQPASQPVEKVEKPSAPALNPAKRAEAIEHYNKGNKLYLQKKYAEALAEYKQALESDSTFAYAHRGLGVTYASQGKNEKAIEAYKNYLQLAPDAKDAKQVKQIISNSEK